MSRLSHKGCRLQSTPALLHKLSSLMPDNVTCSKSYLQPPVYTDHNDLLYCQQTVNCLKFKKMTFSCKFWKRKVIKYFKQVKRIRKRLRKLISESHLWITARVSRISRRLNSFTFSRRSLLSVWMKISFKIFKRQSIPRQSLLSSSLNNDRTSLWL